MAETFTRVYATLGTTFMQKIRVGNEFLAEMHRKTVFKIILCNG